MNQNQGVQPMQLAPMLYLKLVLRLVFAQSESTAKNAKQTSYPRSTHRLRLGLSALGLITALLLPLAAQAVPATAPAAVRQGYALLNRGWVNDAIEAFRAAVQQYPRSVDARLGLAMAYQKAGKDTDAWQTYQQVLTLDAKNQSALQAIGLLGGYRPEWQPRGIEALTALLQLSPQNKEARAQRALLLSYQGRFTDALADYNLLLQNQPSPAVILGAAQAYTYSGDYVKGLALFQRYRGTIPNSAVSAYATALQQNGKAADAVQLLETRLRQLRPTDNNAIQMRAALASAYASSQQIDQAIATLQPLRGNAAAVLPLARALSQVGRQAYDSEIYDQAVQLYRQVLQQTPHPSIGFLTEVADVFSESEAARPDALQLYQQLIRSQPQNPVLPVKERIVDWQVGQIDRATLSQQLLQLLNPLPPDMAEQRSLAQFLLRLDPPDPALLPLYTSLAQANLDVPFLQFRIAQMNLQQGKLSEAKAALAAYERTVAGSEDPATELLTAEIERQEGNLEGSAQRYQALIGTNPPPPILTQALLALAGVRQQQGKLPDALAAYEQLVNRSPQNAQALLGQASLAYQTNRINEAQADAVLQQYVSRSTEAPPELFSLVAALPPSPDRLALYQRLLAANPDDIGVARRLVQVLAVQDPAAAQAQVDRLLQRSPNNINVYFIQGELAQTVGNLEQASRAYQQILDRQPNNVDALAALGGVRFQQRQYDAAARLYRRVLALKPNDPETRRILAELSAAQDQPLAALAQLQALQHSSIDPNVEQRIRELQLNLLRRRGFQPYWERY